MRWLLGLGLSAHDTGAIKLASRLRSAGDRSSSVRAVHVVAPEIVRAAQLYSSRDQLQADVEADVRRLLSDRDIDGPVDVVLNEAPDVALAKTAGASGMDAVIVGRRAASTGHSLFRLGRVARRMIRSLRCATVVVPPDFVPSRGPCGTVMLTTDLLASSDGAARFAIAAARSFGTSVTVVHVHLDLMAQGAPYVPSVNYSDFAAKLHAEAHEAAAAWSARHALGDARLIVHNGGAVSGLLSVAEKLQPSLVVCGSRRAGLTERLFTSTVGSGIASHAPLPVAIVPADWVAYDSSSPRT